MERKALIREANRLERAYARKKRRRKRKPGRRYGKSAEWWAKQGRHRFRLQYHFARTGIGNITGAFLDHLWEMQDGRCAYCEIRLKDRFDEDTALDHIKPISRGGGNWKNNVCWACYGCNEAKGTMNVDEFRAWMLEHR